MILLNFNFLTIIVFLLSWLSLLSFGFYYSPIRELRSIASARINRIIFNPNQKSSKIKCFQSCPGISVKRIDIEPPIANGCGPQSFPDFLNDLIPYKDHFKSCCDAHDIGYATCNKPKEKSDRQFFKCLFKKIVDDRRLSKILKGVRMIVAKGYFAAVDVFGCEPYVSSQMSSCKCIRRKPGFDYTRYKYV